MFLVFLFFTLSPLPVFAQVNVFPAGEFVTIPHGNAAFTCLSLSPSGDEIRQVQWLLNGTLLQHLHLENVEAEFSTIGSGVGTLQFTDIPLAYNMTTIRCHAEFSSGHWFVSNDATLLLIQDLLAAVGSPTLSTQDNSIILTWTPPFTLDITDITPDIEGYCVDVINASSSLNIYSRCRINGTEFIYPIPLKSWCSLYLFTLTPVNRVGNGTRTTVSYSGAGTVPRILEILASEKASFSLRMSAPVCTAVLTFVDLDTGDTITLGTTDLTLEENNITFTAESGLLTTNRHYDVTVTATNIAGSATSYITIGTHGVTGAVGCGGEWC